MNQSQRINEALSMQKQALIDDARAAGFIVQPGDSGVIKVFKMHPKTKHITTGLMLFPDGTAIRMDIDLTVSTAIRSVDVMRKVLGL